MFLAEEGHDDADDPDRQPSPWRRFFARCVDWQVALLIFIVVTGPIPLDAISEFASTLWGPIVIAAAVALIWLPVEGVLIAALGFTPGKYLFNVRVSMGGRRLSFSQGLSRAFLATGIGAAFRIPIASLAAMGWCYWKLGMESNGRTYWDRRMETDVACGRMGKARSILAVPAVILVFGKIGNEIRAVVTLLIDLLA